MKTSYLPLARQNELVVHEISDETLIYDLKRDKAHCLNQSAALVWKSCDGDHAIMDIVREFETTGVGKVSEDFVWLAVDQLNEKGLLEGEPVTRALRQSRRQVIKTLGQASMVALPIVASLVAPKNALGSVSCACTSPAACVPLAQCPSRTVCNTTGICAPNA